MRINSKKISEPMLDTAMCARLAVSAAESGGHGTCITPKTSATGSSDRPATSCMAPPSASDGTLGGRAQAR